MEVQEGDAAVTLRLSSGGSITGYLVIDALLMVRSPWQLWSQ